MPFRAKTLPPDVSLTSYIEAYPFPAFVLNKRVHGKHAASLIPIFSNSHFRNLVFGPRENEPQNIAGGGLLEALPGTGFEGIENARKLGEWIDLSDHVPTYILEIEPPWLNADHPPIQLELIKTSLDPFWIITTVPRAQLPRYISPPIPDTLDSLRSLREPSGPLRLSELPTSEWLADAAVRSPPPATPTASPMTVRTVERDPNQRWFTAGDQMQGYLTEYPWHQHPLGPIDQWPQSLKTIVSCVMASPYPWALWWGPDLVLIYNDAYALMAGSKHPHLFAKGGKVAWGELWEELGPLSDQVLRDKKAVAFEDDMMFFGRLTEKMLPEEVYHSWAWIPVRVEDGSVGGFLNTTFESTSKILYERRIQILRSLGDKTALARSKDEFAEACLKVLTDEGQLDMPFVAFYYNTVDAPAKAMANDTTETPKTNIIRVTSKLTFKIGIPDGHEAIPERRTVILDPVTLRPPLRKPGSQYGFINDLNSSSDETTTVVVSQYDRDGSENSESLQPEAAWPFFDIFSTKRPLHVQNLPQSITKPFGYRPKGYNDAPREAVVIPIAAEGDDVPVAIIVIGLNTRRPYDKEHQTWIELIHMTLSSTLTATVGREAEMKKAEQLAKLDAAKTSFFSAASHELRTPLTLISGPVNDALKATSEPKVKDLLKLSVRNIARLQRLVESLMDFTRLEAGRLTSHFRATNFIEYTSDLASLFRAPIEKQGIEYLITSSYAHSSRVYLDHDLWEKIVFNIIGNAFKYTISGRIHVHTRFSTSHAEFCVSDTGVGIPEEERERIFERFHRVSATARDHEGTGIGLALTLELVKVHGGHIIVESKVLDRDDEDLPHGTTFTVHIPLGSEHLPIANIDDENLPYPTIRPYSRSIVDEVSGWSSRHRKEPQQPQPPQPEEATPSETTSSEATNSDSTRSGELAGIFRFNKDDLILIVDDNADLRKFIRTIFRPYCSTLEADSADEGLQLIRSRRPNLILSDVMMPGMDGLAFVGAVREQPETVHIPIILLTARSGDESRVEGLLSGADDYISKPFKSQELVARAHLHLQIGKRKAELQRLFEQRTKEIKILSDMSPVGIFRTDDKGQITYTNKRWHEITEYPPSQPFTEWILNVHADFQKDVLGLTTNVLQTSEGASLEIRWRNDRWTKLEIQRIENGLIGTVTDVSDRHLYEAAQIAQAQEREAIAQSRAADAERQRIQADERRRAQELLVDVTSHELRQPVSAILNCSQLVRANLGNLAEMLRKADRTPFTPSQSLLKIIDEDLEALDSIYQCGLSQERIANDVLSLSRLQLDTLSIQSLEFHLVDELKRILSIFSNELRMKQIRLDTKIGDSVYLLKVDRVSSDRTRFAQIVTNLMSNAIKFTDISPADHRDIVIQLDVSLAPPIANQCVPPPLDMDLGEARAMVQSSGTLIYVYVAVTDSGPGLKPGDLALLFQRFQQGSNSHEVFGGSGLGLFVSRKLCELMGGSIDVDSIYGQGATFRFYVKMKTNPSPVIQPLKSTSPTSSITPRASPPRSSDVPMGPTSQTAYHILITEDNMINQTILNRQLKQAGFTTELASNGREALERVKKLALGTDSINPALPRRFDAILMDCEMPVMDGHTATREIRRLEREGVLPLRNRIIALTGNAREGQVDAALNSGMDDVIIKPYKIDELVQKIRNRTLMD